MAPASAAATTVIESASSAALGRSVTITGRCLSVLRKARPAGVISELVGAAPSQLRSGASMNGQVTPSISQPPSSVTAPQGPKVIRFGQRSSG